MSSLCRATLASLLLLQTAASLVPTSPSLRSSPPSLVKGRALGSILASLSGDAAAMPLHWLYNTSTIDELVHNDSARSDFFPTPSCPFYNYRFGENSPYGQQQRNYLSTFASAPRPFVFSPTDAEATYRTLYSTAPCDHHNVGANGTGCYWDGSTKGFMANESRGVRWPKSGANDTQANSIVHSMLLAAKGAGTPGMLEDVEDLIRVTQNTDKAAAFGGAGARILEKVVLGTHTPHEAIVATIKDLRSKDRRGPRHDPEDGMLAGNLSTMMDLVREGESNFDVVQAVGQSCDYPNNLLSGAHLIAQLSVMAGNNPAEAVLNATRQTIMAGGDSASRITFVAAVLGAAGSTDGTTGAGAVPHMWKAAYLHYDEVLDDARRFYL